MAQINAVTCNYTIIASELQGKRFTN